MFFPIPAISFDFSFLQYLTCYLETNLTRSSEFDPWRSAGMSSEFREGGPFQSTPEQPLQIIPGGYHCSDYEIPNGAVNAGVKTVIDNEIAQIKAWVAEYYAE